MDFAFKMIPLTDSSNKAVGTVYLKMCMCVHMCVMFHLFICYVYHGTLILVCLLTDGIIKKENPHMC